MLLLYTLKYLYFLSSVDNKYMGDTLLSPEDVYYLLLRDFGIKKIDKQRTKKGKRHNYKIYFPEGGDEISNLVNNIYYILQQEIGLIRNNKDNEPYYVHVDIQETDEIQPKTQRKVRLFYMTITNTITRK